jgi:hypothetical protein
VQAADQSLAALEAFDVGDVVRVYGRFYKRVEFTARDGVQRSYPAFVTAHPQRITGSAASAAPINWLVFYILLVVALLAVFVVLMVFVRRTRRGGGTEAMDGGEPLPDDPAEALRELRRRAQAN